MTVRVSTPTLGDVRRSTVRPPNAKAWCRKCGRGWTSLTECHCSRCCAQWTSVEGFDRHRVGPIDSRQCLNPSSARDGKGRLLFEGVRTVWGVSYRRRRNRNEQHPWYRTFTVGGVAA